MLTQILTVKVEELYGTNFRLSSFSEKYCGGISVCHVTDDLYSGYEADLHTENKDFLSFEPGSKNIYLEDFYRIFRQ